MAILNLDLELANDKRLFLLELIWTESLKEENTACKTAKENSDFKYLIIK